MNKDELNRLLRRDTVTEDEQQKLYDYLDTEEGKQAFSEIIESEDALKALYDYLDSHKEEISNYVEEELEELALEWKHKLLHPHTSGLKKALEKWEDFWYEAKEAEVAKKRLKNIRRPAPAKANEKYEQLTLPFVSPEDITPKSKKIPVTEYQICTGASSHTRLELLCKLKKNEGIDFCKYLNLPVSKSEKKQFFFDAVDRELTAHPDYCLYILSEKELKWLFQLLRTNIVQYDDIGRTAVMHAMVIGLLEVIYKTENDICTAELALTEEADKIFSLVNDKKTRSFYRHLENVIKHIYDILGLYGMMELRTLYDRYLLYFGNDIDWDEFRRIIYWNLRMTDTLYTGTDKETGLSYAALFEIDFADALSVVRNELPDTGYKEYSKEQFRQNLKDGYSAINPLWDELADFLRSKGMTHQDIHDFFGYLIGEVIDGKSATELFEDLQEAIDEDGYLSPIDQSIIWRITMLITMHNAVAGLKGYSRREYHQMFGKYPASLPLFDFGLYQNQQRKEKAGRKTGYHILCPIYQMPDQIQVELYEIMELPTEQQAEAICKLRKQHGENIELLCLEASAYGISNEYDKMLGRLKKARNLADPKDYPAFDTVIDFYDSMQSTPLPILSSASAKTDLSKKTAAKKTYPNDPCPCGSGKKYKKCCGRR